MQHANPRFDSSANHGTTVPPRGAQILAQSLLQYFRHPLENLKITFYFFCDIFLNIHTVTLYKTKIKLADPPFTCKINIGSLKWKRQEVQVELQQI